MVFKTSSIEAEAAQMFLVLDIQGKTRMATMRRCNFITGWCQDEDGEWFVMMPCERAPK